MLLHKDQVLLIYFDQRNPKLQGKYYLVINNLASLKNSKLKIPLNRRYENQGYFGKYAYTDYFVCLELNNRLNYDFSLELENEYAGSFGTNLNFIPSYLGGDVNNTAKKFMLVYHRLLKKLILIKEDEVTHFLAALSNLKPSENITINSWLSVQDFANEETHPIEFTSNIGFENLKNYDDSENVVFNRPYSSSEVIDDLASLNFLTSDLSTFLRNLTPDDCQNLEFKLFFGETIIKNFNNSSFKRLNYQNGMHIVEVPANASELFDGNDLAKLCVKFDPLAKNATISTVIDENKQIKSIINVDLDYINAANVVTEHTTVLDLTKNNLFSENKVFMPHKFADINNLIDFTLAGMYQDCSSYWNPKNLITIDRTDLNNDQTLFYGKLNSKNYLSLPVNFLMPKYFLELSCLSAYTHIYQDQLLLSQKIIQRFKADSSFVLVSNTSHLPIYQSPFYLNNNGLAKIVISGSGLQNMNTDLNFAYFKLLFKYLINQNINIEYQSYLVNTAYMEDYLVYPTFASNSSHIFKSSNDGIFN